MEDERAKEGMPRGWQRRQGVPAPWRLEQKAAFRWLNALPPSGDCHLDRRLAGARGLSRSS